MARIELTIQNGSKAYIPCISGDIVWETERKSAPGKLTFKVVKDSVINFQEGNTVKLKIDGKGIFYGFVFTKSRNKGKTISVTAYDQLRYFKNKDTYVYKNKTADELVHMLASDFLLQCGLLEGTGFKIPKRIEDNVTLFDIVGNALDVTLQSTKKMYVLYDDFGKVTLKNIESMKLNSVIDGEVAKDFDYATSIDSETYNKIKLSYDNKETGKRDIYVAQDSSNIERWGVLQYYDKLEEKENGKAKVNALLSLYNRKGRNLTVKNVFGDIGVRGGVSLPVTLDLGDIVANTYMVVEKVKHTINSDIHWMDITLRGNDFSA